MRHELRQLELKQKQLRTLLAMETSPRSEKPKSHGARKLVLKMKWKHCDNPILAESEKRKKGEIMRSPAKR